MMGSSSLTYAHPQNVWLRMISLCIQRLSAVEHSSCTVSQLPPEHTTNVPPTQTRLSGENPTDRMCLTSSYTTCIPEESTSLRRCAVGRPCLLRGSGRVKRGHR